MGQPHQVLFHLETANHHQVGQLINYQHQEGHLIFGPLVITLYVPGADLFHKFVAAQHLSNQSPEGGVHLFSVDDHRPYQMGNAIERSQLYPLRVNHEDAQLLRRLGEQE